MMMNRFKKSFTLLELLVVIGILGILISLGMVAFSSVQKKARDSRRKTDVEAMQKMMEQCYSPNSFSYPTITLSGGGRTATAICPAAGIGTFTITDPASNTYSVTSTATGYTLAITLESAAVGTTFSVSNQQ